MLHTSKPPTILAVDLDDVCATSRLDVLVCDAGIGVSRIAGLPPMTADGFDRTFQVNFLGHMLLVELMLPVLRYTTGRVVNVASAASFYPCTWGGRGNNCTELAQLHTDATTSPTGTARVIILPKEVVFLNYLVYRVCATPSEMSLRNTAGGKAVQISTHAPRHATPLHLN